MSSGAERIARRGNERPDVSQGPGSGRSASMAGTSQSPRRAGVTFEIERLELDDDRLVVTGHWSGVRGMRFVRPMLVIGNRRVHATLDHKPWAPTTDEPWTAAFPWDGSKIDVDDAALSVAPSVTVPLGTQGENEERPLRAREARVDELEAPVDDD